MPLTLHIFEERYRQMVQACLEKDEPFGVVLIQRGAEALGPAAEPHPIGCAATIAHVRPLSDGRLNIMAVGQERFRIISLAGERPYLVAWVESYPVENEEIEVTNEAANRLRPFVERYLGILADAGDIQIDTNKFPADPLELGYLAAHLIHVPPLQKQALLAADRASTLLTAAREMYRRELPLLKEMLIHGSQGREGPFSLN